MSSKPAEIMVSGSKGFYTSFSITLHRLRQGIYTPRPRPTAASLEEIYTVSQKK